MEGQTPQPTGASIGRVDYPAHPKVHQEDGDHYQILQHALGLVDLNASAEGRAVLGRYNADADLAMGVQEHKARGRVIEAGELPPSHLSDDERERWLECQRTGDLYEVLAPRKAGGK
jgi:hypothetical protein